MDENMFENNNQNMNDSYTTGSGNAAMVYDDNDNGQNNAPYVNQQPVPVVPFQQNTFTQQNAVNVSKKEKPAKTEADIKRTRTYVIAGVIIVATLFIIACAGLLLFNPKKSLYGAIRRTYNVANINENGPGTAVQAFKENGGAVEADISFEGSGVKNAEVHPGVRVDLVRDSKEDKISGEVALKKGVDDAATILVFSENGKTYVTVDKVLDGYFAADNDGFVETYNNSALSSTFGKIDSEKIKGIELIGHLLGESQGDERSDMALKVFEKAWRSAKVKKAGVKEVNVSREPVNCKVYTVTLDKKDAIEFLSGVGGLLGDKQGQQGQDSQNPGQSQKPQKPGQSDESGNSIFDKFDMFDSFSQQMPGMGQQSGQEPGIGELIQLLQNAKEVVTGPITFDIYVDGKFVRGFATEIDIKGKGVDYATLSIESHNTGLKNVLSSIDFDIELADGEQSLGIEFDSTYNQDSAIADYNFTLKTSSKETTVEASIDTGNTTVQDRDQSLQVVDIGTASSDEVTAFLTKNQSELTEFLNRISEVVGTPEGMKQFGGSSGGSFGNFEDYFSDFFKDEFADFFNDNDFSDFFKDDSFSDFYDYDGFSDFFDDNSGSDSSSESDSSSGSEDNDNNSDKQESDPLSDDDGSEDF